MPRSDRLLYDPFELGDFLSLSQISRLQHTANLAELLGAKARNIEANHRSRNVSAIVEFGRNGEQLSNLSEAHQLVQSKQQDFPNGERTTGSPLSRRWIIRQGRFRRTRRKCGHRERRPGLSPGEHLPGCKYLSLIHI